MHPVIAMLITPNLHSLRRIHAIQTQTVQVFHRLGLRGAANAVPVDGAVRAALDLSRRVVRVIGRRSTGSTSRSRRHREPIQPTKNLLHAILAKRLFQRPGVGAEQCAEVVEDGLLFAVARRGTDDADNARKECVV